MRVPYTSIIILLMTATCTVTRPRVTCASKRGHPRIITIHTRVPLGRHPAARPPGPLVWQAQPTFVPDTAGNYNIINEYTSTAAAATRTARSARRTIRPPYGGGASELPPPPPSRPLQRVDCTGTCDGIEYIILYARRVRKRVVVPGPREGHVTRARRRSGPFRRLIILCARIILYNRGRCHKDIQPRRLPFAAVNVGRYRVGFVSI